MGKTDGGIGGALVKAVADLEPGVTALIWAVCYLLAVLAFVQGCLRLLRHANAGGAGPPLWGAAMSFAIAGVLAALPGVLAAAGETLFGGTTAVSATLGYGGGGRGYAPLLAALAWIVQLVGLIGFVKGIYVLRGASDGVPGATVSGASMHIVGGAMAWHILPLLAAVQTTLGISVLRIR